MFAIGCLGLLAGLGLLVWVLIRLDDGVRVSVENETDGTLPLANVKVSVRGGDFAQIGDVPHGERRAVRLHPKGESDVTLAFVLDGQPHTLAGGHVEASGSDRVELVVREHGTVLLRDCMVPWFTCDAPFHPLSE